MTPRLVPWTRNGRRGEAGTRGEEIQAWLERYQACHGPIADGLDAFADRHIQPKKGSRLRRPGTRLRDSAGRPSKHEATINGLHLTSVLSGVISTAGSVCLKANEEIAFTPVSLPCNR
jgi:hypothetical protein